MKTSASGTSHRSARVPPLPFIGRLLAGGRWWRYWTSRHRWGARLLRLHPSKHDGETGLILVQIDGLARQELERAIERGRMPFLQGLLTREGYRLESIYSGIPATTPAVQAELFYGVKTAVPAFSYHSHRLQRVVRMVEGDAAEDVQQQVDKGPESLLAGGSACTNIYTGGAPEPRFCAAASGWGELFGRATRVGILLFLLLNAGSILVTVVRTLLELIKGLVGAIGGSLQGFNPLSELKLIPSRVAVGVLLRDISTLAACMDAVRNLPIIQLNYLGYDEHAHRRGPDSDFAHATLRGIDRCIERIWHAGHESSRMYSLWVYSDHGQECSTPYDRIAGRTINEVVAELAGVTLHTEQSSRREPTTVARAARADYLKRPNRAKAQPTSPPEKPPDVEVVAIGPLGHVYLRTPSLLESRATLAARLTKEAQVPLALLLRDDQLVAYTPSGTFKLPEERAEVFGSDHPFLEELSSDLLALLRHPDAGQLVIGGWSRGAKPVSFVG